MVLTGPGNELGLSLIMRTNLDDYYCSSTCSKGFKILLHSPNDLPRVAHYGIAIPTEFESRIVIKPTLAIGFCRVFKIIFDGQQCNAIWST